MPTYSTHLKNVAHVHHISAMVKHLRTTSAEALEAQGIRGAAELLLILQTAEEQAETILKRLTKPVAVVEEVDVSDVTSAVLASANAATVEFPKPPEEDEANFSGLLLATK